MLLYSNNIRLYRGEDVLGKKVIKSVGGNIKGDCNEDIVYLLGESNDNISQYKNLEVICSCGHTGENISVSLISNKGYRPSLTLENFIDKEKKQIVVVSSDINLDKGDNICIYNFENNVLKELLDTEKINSLSNIKVKYDKNYKVEVLDLKKNKKYYIDLRNKSKNYLSLIYDENGKPYKNKQCSLSSLYNIYALDIDRDNVSEIIATQKIIGENNLDILGSINIVIKYVNGSFKVVGTEVLLEGDVIEKNRLQSDLEEECKRKYEIDFSRIDFIESQKNRDLKIEKAIEDEFN
ncbi:hypothetical protein, partial [Clostridium sp.]|uniref:hypothetical protein n=1 Tax=Clostridium sp. TaxID=1506 RepID=UPI003F314D10